MIKVIYVKNQKLCFSHILDYEFDLITKLSNCLLNSNNTSVFALLTVKFAKQVLALKKTILTFDSNKTM